MGIGKSATVAQSSSLFLLVDQIHSGKKYLRTKVPHLRTNEGTKVHVIKNKASCYHLPVIDYMCINNTKVVYLHIISHIHMV